MDLFNDTVSSVLEPIESNQYLSAGLSLVLVLYAGLAAPALPASIARLFDYNIVKLIILFLIVYGANKDPTVAIIAAVAVMVSLNTLNKIDVDNRITKLANLAGTNIHQLSDILLNSKNEVVAVIPKTKQPEPEQPKPEQPEQVVVDDLELSSEDLKLLENNHESKHDAELHHQYVNMDKDSYIKRMSENNVNGFDVSDKYALL